MIYSKKAGYTYFYPGYFAPNYPVFDYKINIGKSALYYFDIFSNHWIHYNHFSATNTPIEILQSKMLLMEKVLRSHEIKCAKLGNEFYNANNIGHLRDIDFFDYPEFIFVLSNNHPGFTPIIVFDVIKNVFIMVKCYSWYHDTKYISDGHYFGEHLMKIEEVIFTSSNENDFPNLFITTDTAQE
jgi:arginine-tRNA-protein transferase